MLLRLKKTLNIKLNEPGKAEIIYCSCHMLLLSKEDFEKIKLNEPGKAKFRKAGFLAVGKACKATFRLTPNLKYGIIDPPKKKKIKKKK